MLDKYDLGSRRIVVWMAVALVVVVADQVTKWAIIQYIPLYGKVPLYDFINLTHQQNRGAAFSFLANESGWQRWFFVVLAIAVSGFIAVWLWRIRNQGPIVLAAGLAELGLISGPSDRRGLRRFFMHGTSHYLGLDVHDVGSGGPMAPGTTITVEPGIYIPVADDIDPKWWNIGIRIEDDILVTTGDPVILSASVPRQIDEIEALMRARPGS